VFVKCLCFTIPIIDHKTFFKLTSFCNYVRIYKKWGSKMAKEKREKESRVEVEITPPQNTTPKPANHFVVSFIEDDFSLDIIYINPYEANKAIKTGEKVKGEIVSRISMTIHSAKKLRDNLDVMIKLSEGKNE